MEDTMKVQGNRYINNPEMIKNKVEKKTTVPQNIIMIIRMMKEGS